MDALCSRWLFLICFAFGWVAKCQSQRLPSSIGVFLVSVIQIGPYKGAISTAVLPSVYWSLAVMVAAFAALRADLRRRRLALTRSAGWHLLTGLDVASTVLAVAIVAALLLMLMRIAIPGVILPPRSPLTFGVLVSSAAFFFLWQEGVRQVQFQRPRGILFAEMLILGGVFVPLASLLFRTLLRAATGPLIAFFSISAFLIGCGVLISIVPPFVKKGAEYHRILDHVEEQGESVQEEYTPPTPECPNPQLWHMADSQSTEFEVLDFLKILVTTVKPQLVVETGTFLGYGAIALAQGLKSNGFGKVITIEHIPPSARRRRNESRPLASRTGSSLEMNPAQKPQSATRLTSSSAIVPLWYGSQEIRRLLPQISPRGLIAIHDASSHFKIVRDLALRMEQEGLISVVMLPTP